MEPRPKIKITPSPLDNKLELTSKIILVIIWTFALYTFWISPAIIPSHFNASGQVDDYGNKLTILILPTLGTLFYFGLTTLNKYPHTFNYMTKITANNAEKQYAIATRFLRFLKLAILVIFSLILLFIYLTIIGF
jgi:uncharacterized membrane protein